MYTTIFGHYAGDNITVFIEVPNTIRTNLYHNVTVAFLLVKSLWFCTALRVIWTINEMDSPLSNWEIKKFCWQSWGGVNVICT